MSALLAFVLRLAAAMLIVAIVRAVTHEAWSARSYARLATFKRGRTRKARKPKSKAHTMTRAAISPWGEP